MNSFLIAYCFVVETLGPGEALRQILEGHEGITDVAVEGDRWTFETTFDDERASDLLSAIVGSGIRVRGFHEQKRGVEDLMIRVATEVS